MQNSLVGGTGLRNHIHISYMTSYAYSTFSSITELALRYTITLIPKNMDTFQIQRPIRSSNVAKQINMVRVFCSSGPSKDVRYAGHVGNHITTKKFAQTMKKGENGRICTVRCTVSEFVSVAVTNSKIFLKQIM